jgi:hypothetical protein
MMLLASTSRAETPKFSADQCRVLKQTGVDTTGICPPPPRKEKK